ncbi:MAG: prenyltransferase [Aquificaceae bacterium]|nr:MAG: prenyltransferase [Aquificaceae bacterium]
MNTQVESSTEPSIDQYSNIFSVYFAATRPPFILATLIPILIGMAYTHHQGFAIQWGAFFLALLAGAFLHAGVNVLNDYYDALNGTDDFNEERIYPFTGGSRFIQNQILTKKQMRNFGWGLIAVVVLIGFYLVLNTGWALLALGIFGILIGWAYSAPPFRLNSRGLGELTVLLGFGLLPFGAWLSQTGVISLNIILIAIPIGLLTCNLLYINQYPDRKADIHAKKMHWVARLPTRYSRWGYVIISSLAWSLIVLYVSIDLLPKLSLISLLPIVLSIIAAKELFKYSDQPQQLEIAIKMTLLSMLLHGLLLTVSLLF